MPQHKELDVLGGGRAPEEQDESEHLLEDQIQQPQRHGGDHARLLEGPITPVSSVRHLLEPHRAGETPTWCAGSATSTDATTRPAQPTASSQRSPPGIP